MENIELYKKVAEENETMTLSELSKKYKVSKSTISNWIYKAGFKPVKHSNNYSEQLQQLKQENEELKIKLEAILKKGWGNPTKCHHLVVDECSLTAKTCKGSQECFNQAEQKLEKIEKIIRDRIKTCYNCRSRATRYCDKLLTGCEERTYENICEVLGVDYYNDVKQ